MVAHLLLMDLLTRLHQCLYKKDVSFHCKQKRGWRFKNQCMKGRGEKGCTGLPSNGESESGFLSGIFDHQLKAFSSLPVIPFRSVDNLCQIGLTATNRR
jgi:hypothetical protein